MLFPYKDASLPISDRVADLLSRMTVEEKIAQMHAFWLILSEDGKHRVRSDEFTWHSDEDKLQQMWHDKVMAIPPELFTFPDDLAEHTWEPRPVYSNKGESVPYWAAMRRWLADESVADMTLWE